MTDIYDLAAERARREGWRPLSELPEQEDALVTGVEFLIKQGWFRGGRPTWASGFLIQSAGADQYVRWRPRQHVARPTVVCLCGSTRFYQEFQKANYYETMAGRIVLSVGFFMHSTAEAHGETVGITPAEKEMLDELHKRKIDLADEVLILNVGGYIGESTRSEIEYANRQGKLVRYLEPPQGIEEPGTWEDYIRVDLSSGGDSTRLFCGRCGRDAHVVFTGDPDEAMRLLEQFWAEHRGCAAEAPAEEPQGADGHGKG